MDSIDSLSQIETIEDQKKFLLNLTCFAACVEGLFFFGAFAYVYFLRSKGLFQGLASGTNWVFRDESCHMNFAFEVIERVREESPELFDDEYHQNVVQMMEEAVECEMAFANDLLAEGISGLSARDMRKYLEFTADQRLGNLGYVPRFRAKNPFSFIGLQDVQELANFFERRVSAYQTGIEGEVSFDEAF